MDHGAGSVSSVVVWRASDSDPVLAAALGKLLGARGQSRSLLELAPRSEGVARRGMPRATPVLDLTPESWRKVRRVLEFRTRAIGILAAVLILWALSAAALFGGVGVEEGRLRALEAERDMLKPKAMDVRTLRRRVIQLGTYGKGALSALDCMREIASIQPQGLDLNSFTYRKGDALKIGGECEDVNLIYDFRRKLDASSTLAGATLNGPAWDRQRRKNTFEVELKLPEASE